MANDRIFNFSAGPSMLPLTVLERAGKEITNYQGSGMSVMEMSHRSKVFQKTMKFSFYRAALPLSFQRFR